MRWTNQQITTIEETLVLNGVVYDDIKLELVDHIATEMRVGDSREKPLRLFWKVVEKVEPQLKPTSHKLLLLWVLPKDYFG
jgi:hypothetical protein